MTELLSAIIVGKYDADLDAIREAIRMRQNTLVQAAGLGLKQGDIVMFNDHANPKYLKGVKATVVKKNAKSVTVNLDATANAGRFSGARGVRCPLSIIDKVEETVNV